MATLVAPKDFSPVEDAEKIKKACLGWGTDEKAIISVLGHRNSYQRKLIRLAYEEIYHEDLIHQLKSELSGDFERAICQWSLEPAERDAALANRALRNGGAGDYRVIVEIACVGSPEDLLAVKRAYRFRYKHSLEEDVASHTTGPIRKILVGLVSAYRYEGHEIEDDVANSEAAILHDDIVGNAFNHEELVRVLTTRSKPQLNATFNRYQDIHGKSITKGLLDDPLDEYLGVLRTAIRCIRDPKNYFAKVLRRAMNREGQGSDEDALSRVIVSRAEKDLKEIEELYLKRNDLSLHQAVARDTSGDYKDFLLALLGEGEGEGEGTTQNI